MAPWISVLVAFGKCHHRLHHNVEEHLGLHLVTVHCGLGLGLWADAGSRSLSWRRGHAGTRRWSRTALRLRRFGTCFRRHAVFSVSINVGKSVKHDEHDTGHHRDILEQATGGIGPPELESMESFASMPYDKAKWVRTTSRKANMIIPKKKLICMLPSTCPHTSPDRYARQ